MAVGSSGAAAALAPARDEAAAMGPVEGGLVFECHGALIEIRSADAAALELARRFLPPGSRVRPEGAAGRPLDARYSWKVGPCARTGRTRHAVAVRCSYHRRPKRIADTTCTDTAATLLAHDAEFRVALYAPERLFVHAAAVAWRGAAIVVPGHSHTGKSTLTAALVRAGAAYYSDEYTILDAAGLVHAFPRRLHLRSPVGEPSRDVPVEELGGAPGATPLPVGLVLCTAFRPGATWSPTPMTRGQMALALFDNTILARIRPALALERIATALGERVVGLHGPRGDADETAARLLDEASRLLG